jgi:hypothetical protein
VSTRKALGFEKPCGCQSNILVEPYDADPNDICPSGGIRFTPRDPNDQSSILFCPLHKAAPQLLEALKEFTEHDGIVNYDSRLCWACGEPKGSRGEPAAHNPECLLQRANAAIAAAEGEK